jgi:hypothetical protein
VKCFFNFPVEGVQLCIQKTSAIQIQSVVVALYVLIDSRLGPCLMFSQSFVQRSLSLAYIMIVFSGNNLHASSSASKLGDNSKSSPGGGRGEEGSLGGRKSSEDSLKLAMIDRSKYLISEQNARISEQNARERSFEHGTADRSSMRKLKYVCFFLCVLSKR